MNVFAGISALVQEALEDLVAAGDLPAGLDFGGVGVEPSRDPAHGDMASNAAMVLAKAAGVKPRDLAKKLAAELARKPQVASAEVAGPGFINLRLVPQVWLDCLGAILENGVDFGNSSIGKGRKVNVEYVSTNPTGPLHMGHVRGAVFGDALSKLLAKAGFEVLQEYYINDAGTQVDALARSAHLRYRQALGEDIGGIPEGLYPGGYLIPVGQALAKEHGDKWLDKPESEWLDPVRRFTTEAMMDLIRDDLALLGIEQDVFFSELSLHESGAIDHAISVLEDKGLIYQGVLEPPKGKEPEDWEPRQQTLFRATRFGDDVDRPLKKSDGGETYFSADIAYHLNKFERGYKEMIDVWGADHGGYVKRMKAAVEAVTGGEGVLDVKICQMVKLLSDGEPVRMSKRSGAFITLRAVVEEVGRDVVRFIMLTRKNDATLEFDFAKVTEQSKDNPVFYVQYAHARVCSVFRKVLDEVPGLDTGPAALRGAGLGLLGDEELVLVKHMAAWPRLVETAAEAHEPHRVAFFLYDLASAFHALWNRGNEDPVARFIVPTNANLTLARLALARGVALVIASGLAIMGVEPAEEMRWMTDDFEPRDFDQEPKVLPPKRAQAGKAKRRLAIIGAVAVLALFGGYGWYAYDQGGRNSVVLPPPVIKAEQGPAKIEPNEPGGLEVPHQDKMVYNRVSPGTLEDETQDIIQSAEEPSPRAELAAKRARVVAERKLAARAAAGGDYVVQVASFQARERAETGWETLAKKHDDLLGLLSPDIKRADLGAKGIYYRLRAGPFADRAAAAALCSQLKSRRVDCLVTKR